ncbi:alpha/beta fold hydrolase [Kribbella sp. NPDC056861]|uniref:thioesterase II family protein n=1 Tax=Kribbella sp. NPDC056861 TaxID=3154857 RepID=UPI0034325B3C
MTPPTVWIRRPEPLESARVRLVCLPHAGGAAEFFHGWTGLLAPGIEVAAAQYPGHGDRRAEPCLEQLADLVTAIATAVRPLADRPIALFGHSLGALVAYEVARLLEPSVQLAHLFVSGRHAPGEHVADDLHEQDDDALIRDVLRLGGTKPELFSSPELRSFFLPAIRSGYRVGGTYTWSPGPEPSCPITALRGADDPEVSYQQLERWAAHSTGDFAVREFAGEHFYLTEAKSELITLISASLQLAPVRGAQR